MANTLAGRTMRNIPSPGDHPAWVVGFMMALALALTLQQFALRLPLDRAAEAIWSPDLSDVRQVLVGYSFLPRVVVSLLVGATLGLAGSVFQQVLRNPLASPTTLGVSAGAQVALATALVWAPGLLAYGREVVVLVGGGLAALVVFGLAWSRALSPVALILAGLIVNLYCGALEFTLTLFNQEELISLFIWGAGSLVQNDWSTVLYLLPRVVVIGVALVLMVRPLSLLDLDDESVRSLGLSLVTIRLLALGLAVALSAFVVSAVGVIGFVGLAAPALVRLLGARRFQDRLLWAPLLGAALLWLTDMLVQLATGLIFELPTGAVTSVVGAPLLLWLLPRLRPGGVTASRNAPVEPRSERPQLLFFIGVPLLLVLFWLALTVGRSATGWQWAGALLDDLVLDWRVPRLVAAVAAGALLALAGTTLQRFSGNPMASPEVLGISSGAGIGIILIVYLVPNPGHLEQLGAAGLGAFVTLLVMLWLGRKSGFTPERMLLAGIAVGTIFGTVVTVLMATGDPRIFAQRGWLAGSTYRVTAQDALWVSAILGLALAIVPLLSRWLDVLPLGAVTARGVGINLPRSRLLLLLWTAAMTAAATLVVGPISFVGLMAPHMARMMGLQRALTHLYAAALLGALIMIGADWFGRNLMFPYQLPAGLVATFIGGPYLLWLLRGRAAG